MSSIDPDDFVFRVRDGSGRQGTGLLISKKYILTCAHVVQMCVLGSRVKVKKYNDSREYDAKLLWLARGYREPGDSSDLAILKIEEQDCESYQRLTSQNFLSYSCLKKTIKDEKKKEEEKKEKFSARGFPSSINVSSEREFTLEGTIDEGRAVMIVVEPRHWSGGEMTGFSGASVWRDSESSNDLVGIIIWGIKEVIASSSKKPCVYIILASTLREKGVFDFIYKDSLLDILKRFLPKLEEGLLLDVCRIFQGLVPALSFKNEIENPSQIQAEDVLEKIVSVKTHKKSVNVQGEAQVLECRVFQFASILLWCLGKENCLYTPLQQWIQDYCENSDFVLKASQEIVLVYRRCMQERDYLESKVSEMLTGKEELMQSQSNLGRKMSDIEKELEELKYRLVMDGERSSLQTLKEKINFQLEKKAEHIVTCFFFSFFISLFLVNGAVDRVDRKLSMLKSTSSSTPTFGEKPKSESTPETASTPKVKTTASAMPTAETKPKSEPTPEKVSAPAAKSTPSAMPTPDANPKLDANSKPDMTSATASASTSTPSSNMENLFEKEWMARKMTPELNCGEEHYKENYSPGKRTYLILLESNSGDFDNDLSLLKEKFCVNVISRGNYTIQVATIVGEKDAQLFKAFLEKHMPGNKRIILGNPR